MHAAPATGYHIVVVQQLQRIDARNDSRRPMHAAPAITIIEKARPPISHCARGGVLPLQRILDEDAAMAMAQP